jgi:NADPH:quinone reductase-like Zn-dependent oxidoreductase
MKAIVCTAYGPPDVLELQEREKPSPKDNEVLVKVHAASVNAMDWRLFTMPLLLRRLIGGGWQRPKNLSSCGADVAGTVEAVGPAVTLFKPGDAVFGLIRGSFAEYACAAEVRLTIKPANVSFEEAAAVPVAALTALQSIRDQGKVRPGHKVLVNGAGGGVGTFAVQIAKAFGAEVTAVCSTRNQDVARSIGADHVVDYTREDATKSGHRYDVVLAVNGNHSMSDYKRALTPNGVIVVAGGGTRQMIQGSLLSMFRDKKVRGVMARPKQADLVVLRELLQSGKIAPVIDRRYSLAEVPAAISYLIGGHSSGKVIISVTAPASPASG